MDNKSSRRGFLVGGVALATIEKAGARVRSENGVAFAAQLPASGPQSGLRYATLGRTGLKTTRLTFGASTNNDPSVIARAFEMGINHFETGRDYQRGNNERMLGAALKGKRDNVILASKTIDVNLPGQPAPMESVQDVLRQLDVSLKELGTDHLDIWYLHKKDRPDWITPQLLEACRIAKKQGKVRFLGVSTHDLPALVAWLETNKDFDVVETMYNFTMDQAVGDAIARVKKAGLGVVAMKTIAGGPRGKIKQLKQQGGMAAALKWAMKNSNVDTVVTSIDDDTMLEEDFAQMSTPFTLEDARILQARLEEIGPLHCRSCGHCSGTCRKGLSISDIIRYGMYADGYGQFSMGREKFLKLPEAMRAVRCSDCSSCSVQCRFGIRVAQLVGRTQEIFV